MSKERIELADSSGNMEGFFQQDFSILRPGKPEPLQNFKANSIARIFRAMIRGLRTTLKGNEMPTKYETEVEFAKWDTANYVKNQKEWAKAHGPTDVVEEHVQEQAEAVRKAAATDKAEDQYRTFASTISPKVKVDSRFPKPTLMDNALHWLRDKLDMFIVVCKELRHEIAMREFVLASMNDDRISPAGRSAISELTAYGAWIERRFGRPHGDPTMDYRGYYVDSKNATTDIIHINIWREFKRAAREAYAEGTWNIGHSLYGFGYGVIGLQTRLRNLPDLYGRPEIFSHHPPKESDDSGEHDSVI